jgi:Tfp pilus assembly protein PilO
MAFDYKREYHRYKKLYLSKAKRVYKKPLTKASINFAISLILISFFLFFAIRPTLKTLSQLNQEIKSQKEVSKKLSRKITSLKTAEKNYQSIENELGFIDTALPKNPEFITGAKKLVYLAQENNLKLKHGSFSDFELVKNKTKSSLNELEFKFTAFGGFTDIEQFLKQTEQLNRLYTIQEFNINTENQEELKLTIDGMFYWQTEDKQ